MSIYRIGLPDAGNRKNAKKSLYINTTSNSALFDNSIELSFLKTAPLHYGACLTGIQQA